jgi:hypothetical protein
MEILPRRRCWGRGIRWSTTTTTTWWTTITSTMISWSKKIFGFESEKRYRTYRSHGSCQSSPFRLPYLFRCNCSSLLWCEPVVYCCWDEFRLYDDESSRFDVDLLIKLCSIKYVILSIQFYLSLMEDFSLRFRLSL